MLFRFRSIAVLCSLLLATPPAVVACQDETTDTADGSAGTSGSSGTSGDVGVPSTCSAGVPRGDNCTQGTFSVGSVIHARGLSSLDGREVKAAFTRGAGEARLSTTVVNGGAFDLDFLFISSTCNLGAPSYAAGAFYIDVNADGACDPAVDRMFVWGASGGPPGTCAVTQFTPESPACENMYYGTTTPALTAAQTICPAVGSCLAFCGTPSQGAGGTPGICDAGADDASGS